MRNFKLAKVASITIAALLCAFAAFAVVGCSGEQEEEPVTDALQTDTGLTGGVAATVNGEEIEEDKVTRYINNFRIRGGYEEEEAWKEYLKNYNYTPQSLRDEVINTMIDQQLILQCADQRGVTTSDEEIDSYVQKMRDNYSSDEAWQTGLEGAGFEDEDAYREALRYSILNQKLEEGFEAESEPDEAKLLESAQTSMTAYNGAKRSSHILFNKEDKEKAEEVLEQLRSGAIDFATAAKENSQDTGSAEKGGDVGWDKLTTFVTEYQTALDGMGVGDISDLVESEYGYHIITVTEEFTAPETLESTSQIPEDMLAEIKSGIVTTSKDQARENWLDSLRDTNDVVINDMPDGLPYWVDMSDVYTEEEMANINNKAEDELVNNVAETEAETTALEGAAGDSAGAAGAEAGGSDVGEGNAEGSQPAQTPSN